MKEVIVSVVKDLTDDTLLVIRDKSVESLFHRHESFPMDVKKIGQTAAQCAVETTHSKTGIIIQNPIEVARVHVKMDDKDNDYEIVFFLSTEFSGTLHPAKETDVIWQKMSDLRTESRVVSHVILHINCNKYVKGTYNFADEDFTVEESRDL